MISYSIKIIPGDHPGRLHIHFSKNKGKSRELLGRYEIPSLEPLPGSHHKLSNQEHKYIEETLSNDLFKTKIQNALKETMFSLNKLAERAAQNAHLGEITKKGGKTFITIHIPIVDEEKNEKVDKND